MCISWVMRDCMQWYMNGTYTFTSCAKVSWNKTSQPTVSKAKLTKNVPICNDCCVQVNLKKPPWEKETRGAPVILIQDWFLMTKIDIWKKHTFFCPNLAYSSWKASIYPLGFPFFLSKHLFRKVAAIQSSGMNVWSVLILTAVTTCIHSSN